MTEEQKEFERIALLCIVSALHTQLDMPLPFHQLPTNEELRTLHRLAQENKYKDGFFKVRGGYTVMASDEGLMITGDPNTVQFIADKFMDGAG